MATYDCPRCGYHTSDLCNMRKHLFSRKHVCPPKKGDIDLETYKKEYTVPSSTAASSPPPEKPHGCMHCGKRFSYASGLSRHKLSCHHAIDNANRLKFLEDKVRELADAQNLVAPNVTIQNITNVQNNIQATTIHAFGQEDTSHLTHSFLNRCVRKTNRGLVDLLDRLHFGLESNRNVRLLNKKLPLCETQDGDGNWQYARRDKVIDAMLEKGQGILQDHFEDNQEDIRGGVSDSMFEYILEFFQKMEDRDKSTIKDIIEDIYVLLLNKSKELATVC
jgi:hypothetical protein